MSNDVEYWLCEEQGVCKSRIHTRNSIIQSTTSLEYECEVGAVFNRAQIKFKFEALPTFEFGQKLHTLWERHGCL